MKRLYDWCWEWMDAQETRYGQRAVAGLFGLAALAFGLLALWSVVAACDWLGLNE